METLPTKAADRKRVPIVTGLLDYFPRAAAAVAHCSFVGNEQHNPGEPLHWDRTKSTDHADCLGRHLLQRGTIDSDGIPHSVKVAWRALALAEVELEEAEDPTKEIRERERWVLKQPLPIRITDKSLGMHNIRGLMLAVKSGQGAIYEVSTFDNEHYWLRADGWRLDLHAMKGAKDMSQSEKSEIEQLNEIYAADKAGLLA